MIKIDNEVIKKEALDLSEGILADIELSRLPLADISLKTSRLARFVNDFDMEKVFEYEAGGYPATDTGIPSDVWRYGVLAERTQTSKDGKVTMSTVSILALENQVQANKIALEQSADRNISISSANPNQTIFTPPTNVRERNGRVSDINFSSNALALRKSFLYRYVKKIHFELKFSFLTTSVWLKMKDRIDKYISDIIPDETQKLTAIYDSLNDDNPEKWSNALTTCRRMLKALADKLYPATDIPIKKGKKEISLTDDKYINRLACYIEENSTFETLDAITNSNLEYIGNRLDKIHNETCKGVHDDVTKEEAERCFMHVYMLIGDILEIERRSCIEKEVQTNVAPLQ